MLTDEQIERYQRHITLKEVGGRGQQKLLNSRVLIIGVLGAIVLRAIMIFIGAALIVPQAEATMEQLVQEADQLLYQAKQSGRNRCIFSATVS